MRARLCLNVPFLLLASVASAQWIPAGPSSTSPNYFAVNSRFVFAADDDGFVYRSTDEGRTWAAASPTLPSTSNPNRRLVGLAATESAVAVLERGGLYRSTNDGLTWARTGGLPSTATSPAGLVVTRGGAFATNVTVSGNRRLAVSTDGGATWAVRDSVLRGSLDGLLAVGDTLVRPYTRTYRQSNGAFANECGAAFSADLGVSWTFRPLNPNCFGSFPGSSAQGVGLAYSGGKLYLAGVYVSSDFGVTWTQLANGLPGSGVIGLAARGDAVVACIAVNSRCGAVHVKGAGGTWQEPVDGPPSGLLSSDVFSTGRSFLVGLDLGGAYRSDDGVTWMPAGRFTHNSTVVALARHQGALVAGSGLERFLRSYDRGKTWYLDYRTFPSLDEAAALLSDSVLLAGGAAGVYKSRDLKTWTRIASTPTNVKAFFRAGGRTYLAATGGLYTTTNGGGAWTQVLNHNLNQADVGVAGNRVIVNGGNGSVRSARWSLDAGLTWSSGSKSALVVATTTQAFFAATQNFVVFGGGTFERSLDDGQTWVDIKPMLGEDTAPSLLENQGDTLLAIGPTYFAASLDQGATWRKTTHAGLSFVHSAGSAVNLPTAMLRVQDTVYVAFAGSGVWKRSLADLGLATAAASMPTAAALALTVTPSPTAGPVRLRFTLTTPGSVRLAIYDALGRNVAQVFEGDAAPGAHERAWDASGLAPGVYLARIEARGAAVTQRFVVTR